MISDSETQTEPTEELPAPRIEEIEEEWASLGCECDADF